MRLIAFLLVIWTGLCAKAQDQIIKTSDGVNLFVRVKGKGTPCLYIHGGPGSGSYWLEKFSGESLEQHFQMIYLDQRGVCRSSSPKDNNYNMDRMVKDFEEVRQSLGLTQWITMGHSFGGILQMGYAIRFPASIRGMIMINCALNINEAREEVIPKACEILGIRDTRPFTDTAFTYADRSALVAGLYSQLRDKDLFWKMGYASYRNYEIMSASFNDIPQWNKDLENVPIAMEDYGINFKEFSADMNIPVLFFYGKNDWMVGPRHFRGVKFPNMLLWGSEVGHVPFLENKTDLENAIVSYRNKFSL
jgi:proline iminopeptidase